MGGRWGSAGSGSLIRIPVLPSQLSSRPGAIKVLLLVQDAVLDPPCASLILVPDPASRSQCHDPKPGPSIPIPFPTPVSHPAFQSSP